MLGQNDTTGANSNSTSIFINYNGLRGIRVCDSVASSCVIESTHARENLQMKYPSDKHKQTQLIA